MRRKITIRILNSQFPVEAESPEMERRIREAAEKVDGKYSEYLRMFPGRSPEEILSFVALNSCLQVAELEKNAEDRRREEEALQADLKGYLKDIGKKNGR